MAHDIELSNAAANVACDATTVALDGGYIRIYGGTRPDTSDDPVVGQALLCELRWATPAFGAAVAGAAAANPIAPAAILANGVAEWWRALAADGVTVVWDGNCGIAGADLNFDTTLIADGSLLEITGYTHTHPKG